MRYVERRMREDDDAIWYIQIQIIEQEHKIEDAGQKDMI